MDCDDVELLLAREARTLSSVETSQLADHVAGCSTCRELADPGEPERAIVRLPEDALEDPDLLVLPTIDPIVFTGEHELARGGMGRILRVRDRRLGRDVAIKEILDPRLRARFEREVAITAQLQHPAIVPVYEAGTWPDGTAFYAMRLVSGGTLAEAIARTPVRLTLLPHVIALTDALAYAHARGIVHRDLKPSNVLVGEFGETVVIDWGLAKELGRDVTETAPVETALGRDLTRAGSVLGTPGFMAPEQADGAAVDARADVYALGAILRTVLCGAHDAPMLDDVPADLRAIVERAMANDPATRYATAKDMADELRRFQAGQLLVSRTYSAGELALRWVRRHRAVVIASALAIIIVSIIGITAIVNITSSRQTAETTVTSLLEEQGRAELLAGEPERAATLLAAAYARGGDDIGLRHMLAAATRDLALGTRVDTPYNVDTVGIREGGDLVTVDSDSWRVWHAGVATTHAAAASSVSPGASRLNPEARLLAMFADEHVLHVYDVATGALAWQHTPVTGPTITFGGTRIVLVSGTATELRDAATGTLVATLAATPATVAFTRDGLRVATCAAGELVVADAATGSRIAAQQGCAGAIAFTGANRLAVQTAPRELALWSIDDPALRAPLPGDLGSIEQLLATDERIFAVDSAGTLTMWSARPGATAIVATTKTTARELALSPDGALLAAAGTGERLQFWSTDTLQLVHAIALPQRGRTTQIVAWSPDGTTLATAQSGNRYAMTYARPRGARVARLPGDAATAAEVLLGPDGGQLAVRRFQTGDVVMRMAQPATPSQLARDGRRALITTDRDAIVVDTSTGAAIARLSPANRLELSADGTRVVETEQPVESETMQVRVHDVATAAVVRVLTMPGGEVAISPAGDRLAITARDAMKLVDVATGVVVDVPFDYTPLHVRFSPRGDRVIGYGALSRARIVTPSGHVIAELPPATAAFESAAFDASGHRLVTWGNDSTARLWNADTGVELARVPGIGFGGVAITDDGARFATATERGEIQIWDARTTRLLSTLPADPGGVTRLAWSADGTRLAAVTNDATAIWDVHIETRSARELAAIPTGYVLERGVLVTSSAPRRP